MCSPMLKLRHCKTGGVWFPGDSLPTAFPRKFASWQGDVSSDVVPQDLVLYAQNEGGFKYA